MKVAIASSGLSHIKRGMEGWSEDIARVLSQKDVEVTLFKGSGKIGAGYEKVLPTLRRNQSAAIAIGKITSWGGWRIGLGSPAAVESFVFGLQLLWHIRKGYDIVHVKQGSLAAFLLRAKRYGLVKIPIILSNGQIANEDFLSQFEYVQHLTPALERIECEKIDTEKLSDKRFVIPNFIDPERFYPQSKKDCRNRLGIPHDAFVILTVGSVKKSHKRMDYFIDEMSKLKQRVPKPLYFVIAGARDSETDGVIRMGQEKLGKDLVVMLDISRELMPQLYSAADVFVSCSLLEAFGTVLIEAMSCKLPVVCNNYESFGWIVQDGGERIDMGKDGVLSDVIERYLGDVEKRTDMGESGRARVLSEFSPDVVVARMIDMYETVLLEWR